MSVVITEPAAAAEPTSSPPLPLSLHWSFGFTAPSFQSVHSLTTPTRSALAYCSSHFAVLHDLDRDTQRLLTGHVYDVSAVCVTRDKRFVITADRGAHGQDDDRGSVVIVWEVEGGRAVRVIQRETGVACMDVSDDGMFIAVVDNSTTQQQLHVYDWNAITTPLPDTAYTAAVAAVKLDVSDVTCVRFNPTSIHELVLNSALAVYFAHWTQPASSTDTAAITVASPALPAKQGKRAQLSQSTFIPHTNKAVTATHSGHLIVFDSISSASASSSSSTATTTVSRSSAAHPIVRTAIKQLKLVRSAIRVLLCVGTWLVCGCDDGSVRWFDYQFRIVAWWEDSLGRGEVRSLSFDDMPVRGRQASSGSGEAELAVPPFILATSKGKVIALSSSHLNAAQPAQRKGQLLLTSFDAPVTSVHAHPTLPLFASSTTAASVSVWDTDDRRLVGSRTMYRNGSSSAASSGSAVSAVQFSPHGNMLAVGFDSGEVRLLDTAAIASTSASAASFLSDIATFKQPQARIRLLAWSECSTWLASADDSHNVSLYRYWHADERVDKAKEYIYVGRYRSHYDSIVALLFTAATASSRPPAQHDQRELLPPLHPPSLHSLGSDRLLQEYDLSSSSIKAGLRLRSSVVVEESALPVAMVRVSGGSVVGDASDDGSEWLVIANDEYKLRCWQLVRDGSNSKLLLRRTVLAPTFCGCITALSLLPAVSAPSSSSSPAHVLFSSATASNDCYVGVLALPLLGQPDSAVAVLAHPSSSAAQFSAAFDGSQLLSFSPLDTAIKLWSLTPAAFPTSSPAVPTSALLAALDGDESGSLAARVEQYAMLCEIEDAERESSARQERRVYGDIAFSHIGRLCRALGCYVSQREEQQMIDELRWEQQRRPPTAAGQPQPPSADGRLSKDDFLRLYLHHRPMFGLGHEQFEWAFSTLQQQHNKPNDTIVDRAVDELDETDETIDTAELVHSLLTEGEAITAAELGHCLDQLLGRGQKYTAGEEEKEAVVEVALDEGGDGKEVERLLARLPQRLSARWFASTLLGFDDY